MSNKVAIVTGAGSGIGRHVALALLENDYQVVLAGRRQNMLEETADLGNASACLPVTCNVTDDASVENLFDNTLSKFGRVDLLFNNAGINTPAIPLEDLSSDQWRQVVDVNLTGAFLCTRAAFRAMKNQDPQGGRIINNGSISSQTPRPHSIAYTATKHAITGLTKSTSLDGRAYNIACGQIDIGNAGTDMTSRMSKGVPQANGTIAPEPTMDVGDIGKAVLFMDSLPLESNVLTMTVMATKMPLVGRG